MAGDKVKLINLDDELIDREISKIMCGMIGVECYGTGSIQEFIDTMNEYDGVILDYCFPTLPDIDGLKIAKIIRSKISTYPIIFRSNFVDGSLPYESMLVYGPVIEKAMSHLALTDLLSFVDEIKSNKIINKD